MLHHLRSRLWIPLVIATINPLSAQAELRAWLSTGPVEGQLYMCVDGMTEGTRLVLSEDYGETVYTPLYDGQINHMWNIFYHRPTGDVWGNNITGLQVSHDLGQSFELVNDNWAPCYWNIMQDVDSLVVLHTLNRWSFDTLRTSIPGELNGYQGYWIDETAGWSNGEEIFLTRSDDTLQIYLSTDYSNSFHLLNSITDIPVNALNNTMYLYTGYGEGELYIVTPRGNRLFCSTDWGASWSEKSKLSRAVNGLYEFTLYPGWHPGEVFGLWRTGIFNYPLCFDILYSTDYGLTWTWTYDSREMAVTERGAAPDREVTIRIWPNPTNGLVTVQAPATAFPLTITDILGRRIARIERQSRSRTVSVSYDISDFPSGSYFIVGKQQKTVSFQHIK